MHSNAGDPHLNLYPSQCTYFSYNCVLVLTFSVEYDPGEHELHSMHLDSSGGTQGSALPRAGIQVNIHCVKLCMCLRDV